MQTQVPLSELKHSASNVRRTKSDVDTLASSIRSVGLISPLLVTVAEGGGYEVVAGGRRLEALLQLVDQGHLTGDQQVSVQILADNAASTEASLAENIIRLGMTAADEVQAFRALVDAGDDAEGIARRFGFKLWHVQQRLALANLAPKVFKAFADGILTVEQAQAFTINPDHKRQREVFAKSFENGTFYGSVWQIRGSMIDEAVKGDSAPARYVGADAFKDAGGIVHDDLFGDEGSSIWTPGTLLTDLTEAKMLTEAEELRVKQKLDFVRVVPHHYVPYDFAGAVSFPSKGRPKKSEIGEAQVGRVLLLKSDGTTELDGIYFTDRKLGKLGEPSSAPSTPKSADAVSAKATLTLAHERRDVLRINLTRKPYLSRAVMIFALVDRVVHDAYYNTPTGSNLSTSPSSYESVGPADTDMTRGLKAAVEYAEWTAGLNRSWIVGKGSSHARHGEGAAERCERFLELEEEEQTAWATFALCHSLRPTSSGAGDGSRFHDYLGQKLGIAVRLDYTPTEESFFAFQSKGQMLALLETVDPDLAKASAKLKTGEVKALCEQEAKDGKLIGFVPPQLAFPPVELDDTMDVLGESPEQGVDPIIQSIANDIVARAIESMEGDEIDEEEAA